MEVQSARWGGVLHENKADLWGWFPCGQLTSYDYIYGNPLAQRPVQNRFYLFSNGYEKNCLGESREVQLHSYGDWRRF